MRTHDDLRITPTPAPVSAPAPAPTRVHEHAWQTESAHRTSLGLLRYVICPDCGGRRVDLQPHPERPPVPLSVSVPPPLALIMQKVLL